MDAVILLAGIAMGYLALSSGLKWFLEDVPPLPLRLLGRLRSEGWPGGAVERADAEDVLLELELSRIADRLQAEYAGQAPAKAERIASWTLAYDRVLLELCETAAVTPPRTHPPLSMTERFHVEHELVSRGRSW